LYENVAQCAVQLNENDNVGLVIGATVPQEIQHIRELAPDLPFLLPGIGAQGGDLEKSMRYGNSNGIALINISRGICFTGDMSENAIRKAAENYLNQIRKFSNEF
jgi:orotidine-5'-phosphate decarboxylase